MQQQEVYNQFCLVQTVLYQRPKAFYQTLAV